MTREEAIKIRTAHVNGREVSALDLQQAIFILSKRRDKKMVLPPMDPMKQALIDAGLCFRLGCAIKGNGSA